MPTGASLLAKVSAIIRKTHVTYQAVSFRTVLSRDGNSRLGLGVVRANLDELVDPQPVVEIITQEEVALGGNLLQLGDYRLLFDGNVLETTLQTCDIMLGPSLLKIISYIPIIFDATVVGWQVIARTVRAA